MTYGLNAIAPQLETDELSALVNEDRALWVGAAFLGFVLSTAVTSTLMVLSSQA